MQSTRSSLAVSAREAVLTGIAPDGGLFVDPAIAARPFDWRGCLALPPMQAAERILSHLLPGFGDMAALVDRAYTGKFASPELTPLVPVGEDYVLELFHGPTSAFKDVALSMLPQLITEARGDSTGETVILTATSGDTGKAALEGFHDVPGTRIFVFYPHGGVSAVQRLQMVTQTGANVRICAVRGNFDDCQQGVKRAFAELKGAKALLAAGKSLSSANSINIGRLAPQVVYYFLAYARLVECGRIRAGDAVDYVVPTGNFGDILAGYLAKQMGLPVGKLVCASNENRVLTDFFATGVYDRRRAFVKTSSPSMDILVSSNLERLLFYASGGDTAFVSTCMEALAREGVYRVPEPVMQRIRADFAADCCTERDCGETICRVWQERGYLCDPHTAVAFCVAERFKRQEGSGRPVVVLSTASPYKFPAAVLDALGEESGDDEFLQMERLRALSGRPIPANLASLKDKAVLHEDVIDAEQMIPYILNKLAEG